MHTAGSVFQHGSTASPADERVIWVPSAAPPLKSERGVRSPSQNESVRDGEQAASDLRAIDPLCAQLSMKTEPHAAVLSPAKAEIHNGSGASVAWSSAVDPHGVFICRLLPLYTTV